MRILGQKWPKPLTVMGSSLRQDRRRQMDDLTLETKADLPGRLIENRILLVRAEKVMLDEDLAELYQVPTKRLNEAVRRNRNRFPEDFMFRLTSEEAHALRSQIATSNSGRGGRRSALRFHRTRNCNALLCSEQ